MKSKIAVFLAGATTGTILAVAVLFLSRHAPPVRSPIPTWNQQDVVGKGFAEFRKGSPILARWDIGQIAEECLSDFRSMSAGQARLGLVYDAKDGRHLVFMFSADRDQRGRSVDDRVIAYVYDEQTKKLVGKFWVPMS